MGEATYYCKIKYNSEAERDEGYKFVKSFFSEGVKAEDYWQSNRNIEDGEMFWEEFSNRFPLVKEYLDKFIEPPNHNNGLAGFLDFGDSDFDDRLQFVDNEIGYDAYVWHFAKWDGMLAFVDDKTGSDSDWVSDEYLNPFDSF